MGGFLGIYDFGTFLSGRIFKEGGLLFVLYPRAVFFTKQTLNLGYNTFGEILGKFVT